MVDRPGLGVGLPRDLVGVTCRQQAGADVDDLPDPGLADQVADGARRKNARFHWTASRTFGNCAIMDSAAARSTG